MHSRSQQHLPAILRLYCIMQQKTKAEIVICEPSRTPGVDQTSSMSLLFKISFIPIHLETPFQESMRVNFSARSNKVHIFTFNVMMLELWIAVGRQSVYAALLSHTGSEENQVSFSVLPLRSMYSPAISVRFQIITTIFNILIKSSPNFGLKKQEPY